MANKSLICSKLRACFEPVHLDLPRISVAPPTTAGTHHRSGESDSLPHQNPMATKSVFSSIQECFVSSHGFLNYWIYTIRQYTTMILPGSLRSILFQIVLPRFLDPKFSNPIPPILNTNIQGKGFTHIWHHRMGVFSIGGLGYKSSE